MQLTKKRIVIISAVALILLGSLVAYWIWQAQGGRFFVTSGTSQQKKKDVPQYTKDTQRDLINLVNEKYGKGDYNGAIKLIEGQQNVDNDVELQLLLAGAYANAGKLKESIEVYKKLDEKEKLPDASLDNMASTAERAGEHRLAVDTYKRAKEYAKSSGTGSSDQIATYDYLIAELEKKL